MQRKVIRTVEAKIRGMVTTRLFAFLVYSLKQACDSRGSDTKIWVHFADRWPRVVLMTFLCKDEH